MGQTSWTHGQNGPKDIMCFADIMVRNTRRRLLRNLLHTESVNLCFQNGCCVITIYILILSLNHVLNTLPVPESMDDDRCLVFKAVLTLLKLMEIWRNNTDSARATRF